jgi:hypothetical protein
MSAALKALEGQLASVIEAHIVPLFAADFHPEMRVTIMVRFEDSDDCDVLLTSDDEAGIRALVDRRYGGTNAS